jgi:hypothetical protein
MLAAIPTYRYNHGPDRHSISRFVRSHLKNVFWPPAFGGIGASFQILDNQQVACGLKLGSVALVSAKPLGEDGIWNQNPIFEMTSRVFQPRKQPVHLLRLVFR